MRTSLLHPSVVWHVTPSLSSPRFRLQPSSYELSSFIQRQTSHVQGGNGGAHRATQHSIRHQSAKFHQLSTWFAQRPHLGLCINSTDCGGLGWRDIIQLLLNVHNTIVLSHFTVTISAAAADIAKLTTTSSQPHSFDSQQSFDAWLAGLPVGAELSVEGVPVGFNHRARGLLDDVRVQLRITVQKDDALIVQQRTLYRHGGVSFASVLPRLAYADGTAFSLRASYRLLPDLAIPLYARSVVGKGKQQQVAADSWGGQSIEGAIRFAVQADSSVLLHPPLLSLPGCPGVSPPACIGDWPRYSLVSSRARPKRHADITSRSNPVWAYHRLR